MPTSTFLNLPPEKRQRIEAVALDEFARHPFDLASLSRIIKRTGISKGSLYQYFSDKVDIFFWLLDQAEGRRTAFLDQRGAPPEEPGDLHRRLAAELEWSAAEPRWARIYLRATERSSDPRVEQRRRARLEAAHTARVSEIRRAQGTGEIRQDLDPVLAAHAAEGLLGTGLHRAFYAQLDLQPDDLLEGPRPDLPALRAAAGGATTVAMSILEFGLQRRQDGDG